jgi:hypothetical protein
LNLERAKESTIRTARIGAYRVVIAHVYRVDYAIGICIWSKTEWGLSNISKRRTLIVGDRAIVVNKKIVVIIAAIGVSNRQIAPWIHRDTRHELISSSALEFRRSSADQRRWRPSTSPIL